MEQAPSPTRNLVRAIALSGDGGWAGAQWEHENDILVAQAEAGQRATSRKLSVAFLDEMGYAQ
jgi:hypothetical protein